MKFISYFEKNSREKPLIFLIIKHVQIIIFYITNIKEVEILAEDIVTLILVALIPIIVLFLTLKGDKLSKDISRDRMLLEEAYGPLKGKIGRIAVITIPDEKVVVNAEVAETIVDIRDRFEFEFSKDLREIIDFFINNTYYIKPARIYKEKIKSLAEDSPLKIVRRPKVYIDEYPIGITNAEQFRNQLLKLVEERFYQIENSLEKKLNIQKSISKFILWSLIGYRGIFQINQITEKRENET